MVESNERKRGGLGIRAQLVVSFALAFVVILALLELVEFYGLPFTDFRGRVALRREESLEHLSLIADLKKERLQLWLEDRRDDLRVQSDYAVAGHEVERLRTTAERLIGEGLDAETERARLASDPVFQRLQAHLRAVKTAYGVYRDVHIVAPGSRRILVSTSSDAVGRELTDPGTLQGALRAPEPYLSEVYLDPISSRVVFDLAQVMRRSGGTLLSSADDPPAVMVMTIDTDDLLHSVLHTGGSLGKHGEAVLVDHDGRILVSLKHPLANGSRPQALSHEVTAAPAVLAARGHEGIIEALDYRGEPVLAAYRHVRISADRGWGLVVKQDAAEVFAPMRRDLIATLLLGIVGVLVFAVSALSLATRLTRPLRELSAAAGRVEAGDFAARAPVVSTDEVGRLATAFNSMVQRIGDWHGELEREVDARTEQLAAANRDLTEEVDHRRRTQKELADSRRRLELTLRSIGDGVITTDREGLVTGINGVAERLTGWPEAEAIGRPLAEIFRIENAVTGVPVANPVARVFERGEIVGLANDTLLVGRDGQTHQIADSAAPILDEGGTILGAVLVFRDVTDAYAKRKALEASEARFRSLFEDANDAVFLFDASGKIVRANTRAAELLGRPEKWLTSMTFAELAPKGERERVAGMVDGMSLHGHARFETQLETRQGDTVDVEVSASRLGIANGPIQAIVRDMTESKRIYARLLQSEKIEAVGTLAGGLAHDLNNVLAAVLGLASVLEADLREGSDSRRDATAIADAARRGGALTRGLLNFVRKETGSQETRRVNDLINEVVSILRRTISKDVMIHTRLDEQAGLITCESGQISQAVLNIALNGVHAMQEKGNLVITTRRLTVSLDDAGIAWGLGAGEFVQIEVIDTGCGMDAATRARAFDPFFTTKDPGEGTGLGLSMAHATMRRHHGEVTLSSAVGAGTTVTLTLPSADDEATADSTDSTADSDRQATGTVMVVDDEQLIRSMVSRLLERLGYRVFTAVDGADAIATYEEHRDEIDVVIVDKVMPGMDGIECIRLLRRIDPDLRLVLCSGTAARADAAALPGGVAFIGKPFEIEDLSDLLKSMLAGTVT